MITLECARCRKGWWDSELKYGLCPGCRAAIEAEEAYRKVLAARELIAASERMKGKRDDA